MKNKNKQKNPIHNSSPFVGFSVGGVVGSCVGFFVGANVIASGATRTWITTCERWGRNKFINEK